MRKFFNIAIALVVLLVLNINVTSIPTTVVSLNNFDYLTHGVSGEPPKDFRMPSLISGGRVNDISLSFPVFKWTYGCGPTSGGMIIAYYDNIGYSNLYTGPLYNGKQIITDQLWIDDQRRNKIVTPFINGNGIDGSGDSTICATRYGIEGRTTRGHVDDYWVTVNSIDTEPYIVNKWIPHQNDCLADYMGTSRYGMKDGWTLFTGVADGLRLYAQSKGYVVERSEVFYLDRFTFNDYCNEIDNQRPVIIFTEGHIMAGCGYNKDMNEVILCDTWDHDFHMMKWGGYFANAKHIGVCVFKLKELGNVYTSTISPTQIMLRWLPVQGAISYKIEMRTDATSWGLKAFVNGNATNYLVTGLSPNTKYYFRVAALTKVGGAYDPYMNEASATTWLPTPKTPIQAAPVNGYMITNPFQTFTFAYNPAIGEPNANLSYDIQISREPSFNNPSMMAYESYGNYGQVLNIPAYWLNLSWNTLYYWRVRARNENGNAFGLSPWTTPWILRTGCGSKPTRPENYYQYMNRDSSTNAYAFLFGFYSTDFVKPEGVIVEQSTNGGAFVQIRRFVPAQYGVSIPGSSLTSNTNYAFRVKFFNCTLFSDYSTPVYFTTPPPPPPMPVLKSPANNSQFSGDYVEVYPSPNWTNINQYEVWFSEMNDFSNYTSLYAREAINGIFRFYVPAGLQSSKRYYWKCRINGDLMVSSWSPAWSFTYNKPLQPPSGLMASQTVPRRVDLAWQDNTINETGFKIERKDGTSGVFRIIAYIPSNATLYTDANVIAGVAYSYRVSAYTGTSTSLPSNTVQITAR